MGTVSPIDDGLLDNLPGLLSLKLVVLDRKTIRRMKSGGETPVLVRCSRWIKDEWSWDGSSRRREGRGGQRPEGNCLYTGCCPVQ